jgi:glycosyltransferase involved in cell wall biosynthesis
MTGRKPLSIRRKMTSEKIIFLTIGEPGYSRSWTYFNGARKLGANVEFIKMESKSLTSQFLGLRKRLSRRHVYVVMSPSQYLVPFVRIFLGKKVVSDAGWSLFEGTVLARKKYGLFGLLALKTYLIDLISSHLATKVFVESKNQAKFYSRLFLVKRKKIAVLYTGVDEDSLKETLSKIQLPNFFNNSKIVLFRGKYNRESGIEVLADATKLLIAKDVTFWIFCPGLPTNIQFSRNTYVNRTYIQAQSEISNIYKSAQITVGQISGNRRLSRTIPHKAFESAYLSKPYVTAGNCGIEELFSDNNEIICTRAGDSQDLAMKITYLLDNPGIAKLIGESMNLKYRKTCSQEVLANAFLKLIPN